MIMFIKCWKTNLNKALKCTKAMYYNPTVYNSTHVPNASGMKSTTRESVYYVT